jgi:hypothetical protein
LSAYRRYLERRLDAYEQLEEHRGHLGRPLYREHVLQHGLTRVRAALAWIEDTGAAIEAEATSCQLTRGCTATVWWAGAR